MWQQLIDNIQQGDLRSLARAISLVENDVEGYEQLLTTTNDRPSSKIIGITGPPGAGKSTLTDTLVGKLLTSTNKIAILCIDPSSPFHHGAILGDRIRMSQWYTHAQVYIRSLATRGVLGGLSSKTIEITELLKFAGFEYVIIETAGVGQSEVEVAGLADVTVVVLVPEAGDEIQTMKAGLMEVADIFVINKSDRPDADQFEKNLKLMLAPAFHHHKKEIPILKTVATQQTGIAELAEKIVALSATSSGHKSRLMAEKAWQLIQAEKMRGLNKTDMQREIEQLQERDDFNLFVFAKDYLKTH